MSKELEIINALEKKLGIKIPKRTGLYSEKIGYKSANDFNIIGLSLPNLEIIDTSLLGKLINLKELYLCNNSIIEIDYLMELRNLNTLWLTKNKISDITPIRKLTNLQELWLDENEIEDISAIKNLKGLQILILSSNKILDFSSTRELDNLQTLDLRSNPIQILPDWIVNKKGLEIKWIQDEYYAKGLALFNNPLVDPPSEIVQLGNDAIKTWFKSLPKVPLNEAKVIFVGHGDVGKTTIINCLTGGTPNPNEDVTHQIKITTTASIVNGQEVSLNIWDFGGQEIMHSTHQFFFSHRCLYVLVLDGRRDESPEYWLKLIESFGGDSPTLIVLNKCDKNKSYDLDRSFLIEKYPFIAGFYKTTCSVSKVTGITELYTGITRTLEKSLLFKRIWPANWRSIRQAIENLNENFISQSRYEKICAENSVVDPLIKQVLADFLHDLGVIVYIKGTKSFGMQILQPKWISNAAYRIITSSYIANNNGILRKDDLIHIMQKNKQDDYEFPIFVYDNILKLMEHFELCYSLDNGQYLIPDHLTIQQPELPQHSGEIIHFYYSYESLLPQSIITRFIVRMNNDIKGNLSWRTGVVLKADIYDCLAIVISDTVERKIVISLSGSDRREYLEIIRNNFSSIHSNYKKLKLTENLILTENPKVSVKLNVLDAYIKNGKEKYFSGEAERDFNTKDILESIEPNLTSRTWNVFLIHSSKDKPILENIIEDFKRLKITYWIDAEQIDPGDEVFKVIGDGLKNSDIIIPCLSENQIHSDWCRREYQSVLTKIIKRTSKQKIVPLVLDNLPDDSVPFFLCDLRYERYLIDNEYKKFLDFLVKQKNGN